MRKYSSWTNKWNGGDVSLIMPSITSFWFLIIQTEYLNDKYWDHIKSLNVENQHQISIQYKLNINNNYEGKISFCNVKLCKLLLHFD